MTPARWQALFGEQRLGGGSGNGRIRLCIHTGSRNEPGLRMKRPQEARIVLPEVVPFKIPARWARRHPVRQYRAFPSHPLHRCSPKRLDETSKSVRVRPATPPCFARACLLRLHLTGRARAHTAGAWFSRSLRGTGARKFGRCPQSAPAGTRSRSVAGGQSLPARRRGSGRSPLPWRRRAR